MGQEMMMIYHFPFHQQPKNPRESVPSRHDERGRKKSNKFSNRKISLAVEGGSEQKKKLEEKFLRFRKVSQTDF
jgi:hypothetical protein